MNLDQLNLTQHLADSMVELPEEIHENDPFNTELADINNRRNRGDST